VAEIATMITTLTEGRKAPLARAPLPMIALLLLSRP
jgi:hypothetical protein